MLAYDRQQAVLDFIREHHSATVTELSKRFFISETSIRRDLARLEHAGFIHKTYGGAVIVDGNNEVLSLEARQQVESEATVAIARKASSLVSNGQVIFLDSSSTVLSLVPFLSQLQNLSVITASLKTAMMLTEYPQFRVYVLGGLVNARTFSMRGTLTCQLLEGMYANRLFLSPKGIDSAGNVFCADEEEATTRRMMMQRADETVLLCHSHKLGQRGAFRMCGIREAQVIVCEQEPEAQWRTLFQEAQLKVL